MYNHTMKCNRCGRIRKQNSRVPAVEMQPDNCLCGGKREVAATVEFESRQEAETLERIASYGT